MKPRIAFLIPHIFMQDEFLKSQIFAPANLAIDLVNGLKDDFDITVFCPGEVSDIKSKQIHVDTSLLEEMVQENLSSYLKNNPVGFISNTRQLLSELIAKCFMMAKGGEFDLIHVYLCEDDQALYFAGLLDIPVLFTHHDPYNLYAKYKARFPKLKNLKYISISYSQRNSYPDINYIENIYNSIDFDKFDNSNKQKDYYLYSGRIVKDKGLDTAIKACLELGENLVIIGKNYSGKHNEKYFNEEIKPFIDKKQIIYKGYVNSVEEKCEYYKNAKALLFPVMREEPFGMVMIEANACGTPVIAYNRGAVKEVISNGINGLVVSNYSEFVAAMRNIKDLNYQNIRNHAKMSFDISIMINKHAKLYNDQIRKIAS